MSFGTEAINQSMAALGSKLALYFVPPIIIITILAILARRYFDGYLTRQLFGVAAACVFVGWFVYLLN